LTNPAQAVNPSLGDRIQFLLVAVFNHQFGHTLQPYVISEGTFAIGLQSRTIGAVSRTVVLPSHIVHTFGIFLSKYSHLKEFLLRSTHLDGIYSTSSGCHISRENELAIMSQLIGDLCSSLIHHHKLCRVSKAKLFGNLFHAYFHQFTLTVNVKRIGHRHLQRSLLAARYHQKGGGEK